MKNINRILQILDGWVVDYPSLVVTLLWRMELSAIQRGDIEESNFIMRLRGRAYGCLIEKYRALDPDGMEIFEHEQIGCSAVRRMLPPEILARNEAAAIERDNRRKGFYEKSPDLEASLHIEKYSESLEKGFWAYVSAQIPGIKSLFNKCYKAKRYNEEEDRSILDILEVISYDEEKYAIVAEETAFYKMDNRCHTGFHEDSLKFRGMVGFDGKLHLCPCKTIFGAFYRGQNRFYDKCLSSIDRGLSDSEVFLEKLKLAAIEHICRSCPAIEVFDEGREESLANMKSEHREYYVDYLALAQHYGVRTNLLDLTSDKMIAAFFACTGYNWKDDKYYPYTKRGKGVFYVYRDADVFSETSRVSCVGLQPLSRPGIQSGYVISLSQGEDFNALCSESITFTHDPMTGKMIYEVVSFLNDPFKEDIISLKAKSLIRSRVFSRDVLEETVDRWYASMGTTKIENWIGELGLEITELGSEIFSEQELAKLKDENDDVHRQLSTMVYTNPISVFQIQD